MQLEVHTNVLLYLCGLYYGYLYTSISIFKMKKLIINDI